jgi:hypothetical protein
MRKRLMIFRAVVLLSIAPLWMLTRGTKHWEIVVGWGIFVTIAGFILLRCPHCGRHAWTRAGLVYPPVESSCRSCRRA